MFGCIIPAPLLMPARELLVPGGGEEGQCAGEEFGEGVGCADGLGGGELLFCVMSPSCGGRRGFCGGFWPWGC